MRTISGVFLCICLLNLLSACKTTKQDGASNLESRGDYNGPVISLSQIGIFYPEFDPAEDIGAPKEIFPAAFSFNSGDVKRIRGIKVEIADPCKDRIIINTAQKEIGCNFGNGHLLAFATFDGDRMQLEPGANEPVEGLSEYIQKLKFDASMVKLTPTSDKAVYTLTIVAPR